MGQYWEVIAPSLRERLDEYGTSKLGEVLFDGSPEQLVRLLAVPVQPKEINLDDVYRMNSSSMSSVPGRLLFDVLILTIDAADHVHQE